MPRPSHATATPSSDLLFEHTLLCVLLHMHARRGGMMIKVKTLTGAQDTGRCCTLGGDALCFYRCRLSETLRNMFASRVSDAPKLLPGSKITSRCNSRRLPALRKPLAQVWTAPCLALGSLGCTRIHTHTHTHPAQARRLRLTSSPLTASSASRSVSRRRRASHRCSRGEGAALLLVVVRLNLVSAQSLCSVFGWVG